MAHQFDHSALRCKPWNVAHRQDSRSFDRRQNEFDPALLWGADKENSAVGCFLNAGDIPRDDGFSIDRFALYGRKQRRLERILTQHANVEGLQLRISRPSHKFSEVVEIRSLDLGFRGPVRWVSAVERLQSAAEQREKSYNPSDVVSDSRRPTLKTGDCWHALNGLRSYYFCHVICP